jgi:hypothetical protein
VPGIELYFGRDPKDFILFVNVKKAIWCWTTFIAIYLSNPSKSTLGIVGLWQYREISAENFQQNLQQDYSL